MLTPEYLYRVSEASEELASQLHNYIIRKIIERIMVRLGRGEKYLLTATDKWQIEALQDAGYLLEDITEEIAAHTKRQEQELKEAMEDAGVRAMSYDSAVYKAAGLAPVELRQSPQLVRLMQRNYDATMGTMRNFTRSTASAAQQLFLSELDKAYNLVSSGAVSYTQAVREAVETVASNGVTVRYDSGRRDTIETATLRAVRTGISQATGAIQIARMEEMDWDIILTSAHLGARTGDGGANPGNHLWWQGQFFSRTGKTPGYPNFYEATGYGTVEGLCGVNCRHSFGPGDGVNNPFEDIGYEDNRKMELLNQRQRLLERRIRKTKRELQGLKAAIDNCKDDKLKFELQQRYDQKADLLSRQNKAYKDFCKKNGLKTLQDRLHIAKWDRQQAAVARQGAKRHQNLVELQQKYDKIKSEIKEAGIKGEVTVNPEKVDVSGYTFDSRHMNAERTHGITRAEAERFIREADISLTRWEGRFVNYYGPNGATYVDMQEHNIRTAFTKEEFDPNTLKIREVMGKYGWKA